MYNKQLSLDLVLLNQVSIISFFGREHAALPNVFEMGNSHATTVSSNTLAFL
jgi:hypothetical protein